MRYSPASSPLSRVIYSSGRDKAWPGVINNWLTAISPRFKTPWVATAVIGLIGAVLTATSSVAALVTFTGVMLAAEYGYDRVRGTILTHF